MIVDSHQHLGRSIVSGVNTTEAQLIDGMNRHGVNVAFVMPHPTIDDIRSYHDRIADSTQRNKGRLFGMASIDPWWPEEDYFAEALRCVEELGFVALKLHPAQYNIAPNHPAADKVFRAATELRIPVLIHTGMGVPPSQPSLCIPAAQKYPKTPLILAHAGWGIHSAEAIVAAEICSNIYLEPSWCPTYAVRKMVDALGPRRVLFGSDHLTNLPVELVKFQSIGLSDDELELILGQNALRIFSIPKSPIYSTARSYA